jgi:predicted ATPase/DNA-binding SARP family transcriptional activator
MSMTRRDAMEFRLLGPVEVLEHDAPLSLGTLKQRLMLATLLIEPRTIVSRDQLIDELWGEDPPATAVNALQVYAAGLRRALGSRLESHPAGYRLRVDPKEIDVWRFAELVRMASERLHDDPSDASRSLSAALALWRGSALAGIPLGPRTRASAFRLEESKLDAIEARTEAELALGHHEGLIADLNRLVAASPTREQLTGQLMLALHRCGRSSDALSAFAGLCRALDSELGVDPGDDLIALEHAIRRRDPTLDAPDVARLPVPPGRFIGRHDELANAGELLHRSRLLTLVGPGGCGKTRLALELGRAAMATRDDDVRFVTFNWLATGASVPAEVARVLSVRQQLGEPMPETLAEWLRHRRMLLILDNCEHVIDAVSALCANLLAACSGLRVLTTSREPLMLAGENVWVVPGLAVPAPGSSAREILESDSVRLLTDRAAMARADNLGALARVSVIEEHDADDAAAICRRLDGLPLAIELAAARLRSVSLHEISTRLDHRLDLLSGPSRSGLQRHQTMRATIEWSYDLLDHEDRALFRRLAAFAGGFDLSSVEGALTGPFGGVPAQRRPVIAGLPRLVDRSVVVAEVGVPGGTRYRLLETVREYAAERLVASGEERETRDRHAAWFGTTVEAAAGGDVDQETFVGWAAIEHDNLVAALDWYLGEGGQPALAMGLAAPLWVYWYQTGRIMEGLGWLRRALDAAPNKPSASRGLGLRGAASLARSSGDLPLARHLGEECLAILRPLGDDSAVAAALNGLGATAQTQGDFAAAVRYGRESVEVGSRTSNRYGLAASRCNLGIALRCLRRGEEADAMFAMALSGFRELRHRRGEAAALNNLAINARQRGEPDGSRALALEALRIYCDLEFAEGMADAVEAVAALDVAGGRAEEALRLYEVSDLERKRIGSALITPDERADRNAAVAAATESLGSVAALALRHGAAAFRFREVIDELLGS